MNGNTNRILLNETELQLVEGAIRMIDKEYARLYWNKNQKEYQSPLENTGVTYSNPTFAMRAYNWNDDDPEMPNFEYGSLQMCWYKHIGRGATATIEECDKTVEFFSEMIQSCIISMNKDKRLI